MSWSLASLSLLTGLGSRGPAGVALALAAVSTGALLAARTDAGAPEWAVVGNGRVLWPVARAPRVIDAVMVGLAAGTVGTIALIGFRVLAGPAQGPAEQLARHDTYVWLAAAVGAAAALAIAMVHPSRGLGVALLASPLATLTVAIGFLALNTALGGQLTVVFVEAFVRPSLALGLLGLLVVAVPSLALRPWRTPPIRGTLIAVVAAATLAALTSFGVIAGQRALSPAYSQVSGGTVANEQAPDVEPIVPREFYVDVVARPLMDGREATATAFSLLQTEQPPNDVAAKRIRTEILPVLRQMLDGAQSTQVEPDVQDLHDRAVAAAQLHVTGFEMVATALEQDNRQMLDEGSALIADGNAEWQRWAAGTLEL